MDLHMPDVNLNIPPAALAEIDQQFAKARAEVDEMVVEARRFLARYGPTFAPGLLADALIADTDSDVDQLAGALGIALVELAHGEAPDGR